MNLRRTWVILPFAALVVTGAAQMASGYNRSLGTGSGDSTVGTIPAPSVTATSPATASAHVVWTAVFGPAGDSAPITYAVARSANAGSTWSATSGMCAGSLTATTCDDVLDTAGDYLYRVTASYRSWTSQGTSDSVNVVTDSIPPTVSSIERAPGEADPTQTPDVTFRVTFSEPVSGVDAADLARTTTGTITGTSTDTVSAGPSAVYDVKLRTGSGDGTIRLDVTDDDSIVDAAGNKLGGTGAGNGDFTVGQSFTIDRTAPTASITSAPANPTSETSASFGFATDDPIAGGVSSGVGRAECRFEHGSYTTCATPKTFSGLSEGSHTFSVRAVDGVGNTGSAASYTWVVDTTAPGVTINQATAQVDPTNTGPINFTVVFGEATTDFATGDVTVTGTAGGAKTATVTGSGTTYNVAVTGMSTSGTVIASVGAGAARDAAGNSNTASTSTDNAVTWDVIAPTVTNVTLANGGTLGTADKGDDIVVTYSEVMDASTFCSTWANDGTSKSVSGNGVVTVTITNSGSSDILSGVTASSGCSINFGSVALNANYVSATATFSGNGSNASTFTWNPTAKTISVHLGAKATGTTNSSIVASTPSYTPPAARETDRAGNSIGAGPFTGTSSRL
ncbi:MAG: hypothetical protein WDA27_07715 [Actinomycetota bacterium]